MGHAADQGSQTEVAQDRCYQLQTATVRGGSLISRMIDLDVCYAIAIQWWVQAPSPALIGDRKKENRPVAQGEGRATVILRSSSNVI